MEDFKVYRANWIPGLGHAFAIITFERDRPLYPATERFFIVPTDPLHFEFQRWEYNSVGPEIQSDASLWQYQLEAVEGAMVEFLHDHRDKLGPFYYDIATGMQWHDVPSEWLIQYNLRNSLPGQLAPALSRVREKTECVVLQDFLDRFLMRAMRDCSLRVKPRSNATVPVNVGLLAGLESR
jgi:hypothetical protein